MELLGREISCGGGGGRENLEGGTPRILKEPDACKGFKFGVLINRQYFFVNYTHIDVAILPSQKIFYIS